MYFHSSRKHSSTLPLLKLSFTLCLPHELFAYTIDLDRLYPAAFVDLDSLSSVLFVLQDPYKSRKT